MSLARPSRLESLKQRLAAASFPLWAALIAAGLVLPSIGTGLAFDDFFHLLIAQGRVPGRSQLDLFDFCWDAAEVKRSIDAGIFPWFVYDNAHIAFFRPLASLTHWVDYNLWPTQRWLMHVQSILWYALAVGLVARVYRRIVDRAWVAGLAGLLYAFDEAHALPVSFIANRNAVMALAGGMAAILFHDRWRREGQRGAAVLAPLFLLLGLLSAEAGLGAAAYLLSYALFLDRAGWRSRALSLVPSGAVLIAWQTLYRRLGYGVVGSGLYVDPVREPRLYLASVGKRSLALLVGALGTPPSDLSTILPARYTTIAVVGEMLILAWVVWVVIPILRRERSARFFAFGALAALPPLAATFPSDRLLFFVAFGTMGLVAHVLASLREGGAPWQATRWQRAPARALGVVWVAIHLVIAPIVKPCVSLIPWVSDAYVVRTAAHLRIGPELEHQHLVVVNGPNVLLTVYRWTMPRDDLPARAPVAHLLSFSLGSVEVARTDASTLTLRPEGSYLEEFSCSLLRGEAYALPLGAETQMKGITATVIEETSHSRPAVVEFRFDLPLEDPTYRFIAWDGSQFVEFVPPPVGATVFVGAKP